MTAKALPLDGLIVLDLSHLVAGPFCTMLMADAGAKVIKVERPGGEIARRRWPRISSSVGHCSVYFAALNRGKRSVEIDLKSPTGREALERLIEQADVLVENFRPGVLERLIGKSIAQLRIDRPGLVIASTGLFGKRNVSPGELSRPGTAIVAEAESGISANARDADGRPVWLGFALGDLAAGLFMYGAIMTALYERSQTGSGAQVDVSMFESMLALNCVPLARAQAGSAPEDPTLGGGYGLVPTADGTVALGANSDDFFARMFRAIGRADIADDPRFANEGGRGEQGAYLFGAVRAWMAQRSTAEALATMHEADVPCAEVRDAAAVVQSRNDRDLASFSPVQWGEVTFDLPVNPMRPVGSDRDGAVPHVPALGEANAEILGSMLGLNPSGAGIEQAAH